MKAWIQAIAWKLTSSLSRDATQYHLQKPEKLYFCCSEREKKIRSHNVLSVSKIIWGLWLIYFLIMYRQGLALFCISMEYITTPMYGRTQWCLTLSGLARKIHLNGLLMLLFRLLQVQGKCKNLLHFILFLKCDILWIDLKQRMSWVELKNTKHYREQCII